MASERDCGDRVCSLDYRYVANCVIYVDKTPLVPCDFPCSFQNCESELHHYMACPIWSCATKTTPSPSDMSTLSPLPTHPSLCSSEVCVPSIVFNVLFGLMILAAAAVVFFRRRRALARADDDGIENLLFDDNRRDPIIRRAERMPLLSDRDSNRRPSIPNFLAQPSNSLLIQTGTNLPQTNSIMQETTF